MDNKIAYETHVRDIKKLGETIIEDARWERAVHLTVVTLLLGGTIILSHAYAAELTLPIVVAVSTLVLVFEMKSHEMTNHASLGIIAGVVEAFKKELLKHD